MSTQTIATVVCTPRTPMLGESVLVEVQAAGGHALDPAIAQTVTIDGVPGTRRYVQFSRPGTHTVRVWVLGPSGPESDTATVEVQTPPAAAPQAEALRPGAAPLLAPHLWPEVGVPVLQVAHLPQQPHRVGFAVGQASKLVLHPGNPQLRSRSLLMLPPQELLGPSQATKYEWSFGDGSRIGTDLPMVQHDFSSALDPLSEYQHFDVAVTSAGRTVTRTLTICNLYALLKRHYAVLQPETQVLGFARRSGAEFIAFMTVRNYEAEPITLTERRLVPIHEDSAQIAAPLAAEPLGTPIVIGPKATATIRVVATRAQVPADCVGFSAYYAGQSADSIKVRVGAHFDLAPQDRSHHASLPWSNGQQPADLVPLLKAMRDAVHPGENGVTLSQVRAAGGPALAAFEAARPTLANVAHLSSTAAHTGDGAAAVSEHPIARQMLASGRIDAGRFIVPLTAPQPSAPQVGAECDPDNLPDNLPQGFVCQATPEQRLVITPGRFMNARKGDTVLAPGGNGLIGGLLTQVAVPQRYSHSGIMTRNYDQITHCTASSDRMQDYPVGSIPLDGPEPVDGFRPDIVKYGWPGTITQTVENAVIGEPMNDPETGKPYNMQGFDGSADGATIAGSWQIVPPMVVKPDPMLETDALRLQLHKVADDAAAHSGKFHYRFYGYTDPTIGQTTTAPDEARWGKGTSPGVCSAFIWLMMKGAGMHLEGAGETVRPADLTPPQIEAGAKVGPDTPDGLYLYSAAERAVAAQWLHDKIYDQASDTISQKAGALGGTVEFLTKMADHISNEFLNAFARDHVQTDDDDDGWKNTQDANAVSPDNIMLWNGPAASTPGPYGYAEPLIYREPRYDTVTVCKWKQVQLTGALSGRVTFNGQPVAGATVQLYDGKVAGTDASGHYAIAGVPYGSYVAKTQKVQQDGTFLSANPTVSVTAPAATLDIALALPPDVFRTVKIDGSIHTHYTYHVVVKTEDKSGDLPFHRELDIGPYSTHAETTVEHDVDDAHSILHIAADWQLDKSVQVSFSFNLHDQTYSNSFRLMEDTSQGWNAHCSASNDDAQVNFTVANALRQG